MDGRRGDIANDSIHCRRCTKATTRPQGTEPSMGPVTSQHYDIYTPRLCLKSRDEGLVTLEGRYCVAIVSEAERHRDTGHQGELLP